MMQLDKGGCAVHLSLSCANPVDNGKHSYIQLFLIKNITDNCL